MIKHAVSHIDHGLTEVQLKYLLDRFADRKAFFIETIELPEDLGTVPCGLYGPIMGDGPVPDDGPLDLRGPAPKGVVFTRVRYARRGTRAWDSRMIDLAMRPTRQVTVIAGPHEEVCTTCQGKLFHLAAPGQDTYGWSVGCDHCEGGSGKLKYDCILYTAFGGPLAPQEPGDPGCKDPAASATFWRDHALAK
jgi:hypothetical protein